MSIAEKLTTIAENEQRVFEAGVNKGKAAEYDSFWNGYQNNGNRRGYANAFRGSGWTDETFRPKYPIVATGSLESGFRESNMTSLSNIDTSGATNFNTAFFNMPNLLTIDKVDFSSATNTTSTFAHSVKLHTIGELVSSETTVWHTGVFQNCAALKNFNITGTIATNFTCSAYPTHDSLMSIINALKDYVAIGDTATHTCSISQTNLNKLTDAEKAIATQKGWTLS